MPVQLRGKSLDVAAVEPGAVGPCPVAPDSLQGIKRQQTNPARWKGSNWPEFSAALRACGIELRETAAARAVFATDAGGTAYGLAHGVAIARSTEQVALLLRTAQQYLVPVTVSGGGLTTEGESVASAACCWT